MSKVIISADSTCDLSPELVERYNIRVLPLHVRLGDNSYRDGVDITFEDIYAYYDENKALPTTAAVNIEEYTEYFKGLLEDGDSAVHICTGSAISSCCQNARIAAEDVGNVYVVDSKSLSTGIGARLASFVSLRAHYEGFTYGLVDIADIVFYLSFTALFLFFSVYVLERRRIS